MRCKYVFHQVARILGKVDARRILRAAQTLMHQGHRMHTAFHVTKDLDGFLVFCMGGLEVEEAANYRKIVFHPVMNFLQQSVFSFRTGAQLGSYLSRCLRFFGGLSVEEIAEVLKISTVTVMRDWSTAKAWLYRELTEIGRASCRERG